MLLILGLVGVGILLLTLAEFHEEVAEPFLTHLDLRVQTVVHGYSSPALTRIMVGLTWIGSPTVLFSSTALIAALLWWRRLHWDTVTLLTSMVGAGIFIVVLKLYFHRARPDVSWALTEENSFSFPSGHSIGAVVLYGILVFLRFRHMRYAWERVTVSVVAVALILGIGLSRIYLGEHYPSDVAAGYLVGCTWLMIVMLAEWAVSRIEPEHSQPMSTTCPE